LLQARDRQIGNAFYRFPLQFVDVRRGQSNNHLTADADQDPAVGHRPRLDRPGVPRVNELVEYADRYRAALVRKASENACAQDHNGTV
jgi:hypothetical protein